MLAQLPSRSSRSRDGEPGSSLEEDLLTGIAREVESLEVEGELANDGVVEALHAGPVELDVVGGPSDAELLAAGG